MIEGQPTDSDVGWPNTNSLTNSTDIGDQVSMRQDDTFGVPRTSGGVLNQRHIVAGSGCEHESPWGLAQGVHRSHRGEAWDARSQQTQQSFGLVESDKQTYFRIAQNE